MALWEFTHLNKHGNYKTRIIHTKGSLSIPGKAFGPVVMAKRFKYKYEHPLMGPGLFKSPVNGKLYIIPSWTEVIEGTTLNDIEWVKPKIKTKQEETIIQTFTSSSSDKTYETKYYPTSGKYFCSCPGSWRSQGNCKHIKQMKKTINK